METAQAWVLTSRVPMPLTSLVAGLHRMLVAGGLVPADSAAYGKSFDLAAEQTK